MNTMIMLMRREFWEHRALWIAPLVVPVLALCFVLFGPVDVHVMRSASPEFRQNLAGIMQLSVASFQYMVATIVVFFYLLDCLFTERRERTILFWKSMPVSDTATVLSKVIIALIVVPVGVYVIAWVTHLLGAGLSSLRGTGLAWNAVVSMKVQLLLLASVGIGILWYAPIAGYLLLVSILARRTPFLWAVLPPFVLAAGESLAFRTHYIGSFIGYRLAGWPELLRTPDLARVSVGEERREHVPSISQLFDSMDVGAALTSLHLWAGVAVAAALVYATIRIRARKDDA